MRSFLKIALLLALAVAAWGLDTKTLKPTGYVNDFSNTLDASSKQTLEDYCANLERVTGVQMAIVLVPTLDGEPVEDVANRLYREWGIGKKGKDEGHSDSARDQGSQEPGGAGLRDRADHQRRRRRRHSAPDPADPSAGQLWRGATGCRRADGHDDRAI